MLFKKNIIAAVTVVTMISGCTSSPIAFLNKSDSKNDLEICQSYRNDFNILTLEGASSFDNAQKQSFINLANEMKIRGLNLQSCKSNPNKTS